VFDIVVAADRRWGIGKDNALPWPKLRSDLQHFKRVTTTASPGRCNAVVMGRRTWESKEVAGKPLPNRRNVIVTSGPLTVPDGVIVAPTFDEALARAAAADVVEAVFVIGGAVLIRAAIERPELRYVYLTRIDADYSCDVQLPDLDAAGFVRTSWDGEQAAEDNGVRYQIQRLARPA
jgi:dihydrofolate reductase